jgi:putative transposase
VTRRYRNRGGRGRTRFSGPMLSAAPRRRQTTTPRRPRVVLPGVPLHLIQRGNNGQACFYADDVYRSYLQGLQTYARDAGCAAHAYVLMTNHLQLTPSTAGGAGEPMKRLGQRDVQYVNSTYRRSGTLWEGCFRSCLIQEESYVLGCYRYIGLNPVPAGMVEHPGEDQCSSYRENAQGETCSGLKPHDCYFALGTDKGGSQAVYRELFRYQLDPGLVDEIREATSGNFALGRPHFQEQAARTLGYRVVRERSGRPKKRADTATDDLFRGN